MFKLGIKLGPKNWKKRLVKTKANYCEVWFNLNHASDYFPMFSYLKKHAINTGLHFWATLKSGHEPNIAYPGPTLVETLALIKKNIDIASLNGFTYVNIHCGNRALITMDLAKLTFQPDQNYPVISLPEAEIIQRRSILELHRYALSKQVLFLTETIPSRTFGSVSDYYSMPVKSLIKAAQLLKIFITNDLCHTFADEANKPLPQLWQALWNKTVALAPYTKLLHLNTVIAPYNGTDSHHGITDKDFQNKDIFPTKDKLLKILRLFKSRNDIWLVNEPKSDHEINYFSLEKLTRRV